MAAERAALRASQPGPNIVNANTPMAAQPICAINILYFLAPGEEGVAKRTAQTAPSGAIVIDIPFDANIWSILPSIAIAANAPAEGQTMSLSGGAFDVFSGIQPSHTVADALMAKGLFFLFVITLSFKPEKDLPRPNTLEKDVGGSKMH